MKVGRSRNDRGWGLVWGLGEGWGELQGLAETEGNARRWPLPPTLAMKGTSLIVRLFGLGMRVASPLFLLRLGRRHRRRLRGRRSRHLSGSRRGGRSGRDSGCSSRRGGRSGRGSGRSSRRGSRSGRSGGGISRRGGGGRSGGGRRLGDLPGRRRLARLHPGRADHQDVAPLHLQDGRAHASARRRHAHVTQGARGGQLVDRGHAGGLVGQVVGFADKVLGALDCFGFVCLFGCLVVCLFVCLFVGLVRLFGRGREEGAQSSILSGRARRRVS